MEKDTLFREIFEESFPAISPELRARLRSFLASDRADYKWLFDSSLRPELSQGDIVGLIPSFFFDGTKIQVSSEPCPAILLQHTCDMAVDDGVVRNFSYNFAPLFPIELISSYVKNVNDIVNNRISHKIYVGSIPEIGKEYVVDLNMVASFQGDWLHSAIDRGDVERYRSFSQAGYFFFLAKLTVHFLRADTSFLAA